MVEALVSFPCPWPIKVVGEASPELDAAVVAVMARHAPGFDPERIRVRESRTGRYRALSLTITATGEAQLRAIVRELEACPQVRLVL
ncbi:MAG: DUF493 domain-containing protein [Porticoccaceae bacterium]|nr:MAG: DUF493 domain-containing protein [Porticoccaceae bacterium]